MAGDLQWLLNGTLNRIVVQTGGVGTQVLYEIGDGHGGWVAPTAEPEVIGTTYQNISDLVTEVVGAGGPDGWWQGFFSKVFNPWLIQYFGTSAGAPPAVNGTNVVTLLSSALANYHMVIDPTSGAPQIVHI